MDLQFKNNNSEDSPVEDDNNTTAELQYKPSAPKLEAVSCEVITESLPSSSEGLWTILQRILLKFEATLLGSREDCSWVSVLFVILFQLVL